MLARSPATRRPLLALEQLEDRLLLTLPPDLVIPLDPAEDRFGDQIVTVQAYRDGSRTAFGIFDTGASTITFSAADQAQFTARGLPIPIKVHDGALARGVGGQVVGDVSEPDVILADGLHAAQLTYDPNGLPTFSTSFGSGAAAAANIQAFVGTEDGSPNMPTITGTPILQGRAAYIDLEGTHFDFSQTVAGLSATLPDLSFVSAGYQLQPRSGASDPFKISVTLKGNDTSGSPGRQVTEAPNPVVPGVKVTMGTATVGGSFLFDTGAQMTVISPSLAASLGVSQTAPAGSAVLQGVAVPKNANMYVVSKLVLKRADGGTLTFTGVPIFVAEVGNGLDGVLGMNLFNSALAMVYDPQGSASLSLLFHDTTEHGAGIDPSIATALLGAGVPFAQVFAGTSMPAFAVASGQISGQVFLDYNNNAQRDGGEPGQAGQTVFLDANNNGVRDDGEITVFTDPDGNYGFAGLLPGTYPVREVVPFGYNLVSPLSGAYAVTVEVGTDTRGWNFANVPTNPDEPSSYVAGLYGSLLGRPPDPSGLGSWLGALYQGVPTQVVAQAIWESPEHRGLQVDRYYLVYLNRPADGPGRAAWVNAFVHGARELDVQLGFINSGEFQARNTTTSGFINSLYVDILGRSPDAPGQASWMQAIQNGARRDQVARGILTSAEGYLRVLDRYYADYLNRPPDPVGQRGWLDALLAGRYSLESAALGFLISTEFSNRQKTRLGLQHI